MPLNLDCPCGHTVRIPDEMATGRVKCPVCGELLTVPSNSETASAPSTVASDKGSSPVHSDGDLPEAATGSSSVSGDSDDQTRGRSPLNNATILHATGGFLFAGLPIPSFLTQTSLTVLPERVRLKSSGLLSTRRVDLKLSEISSVDTRKGPAWYLLLLGLMLLPAEGFGLVFLIPFLFVRHSFLIVRCGTLAIAVRFSGDDTDVCATGDAILQAARNAEK